jgi:hypothetical protein
MTASTSFVLVAEESSLQSIPANTSVAPAVGGVGHCNPVGHMSCVDERRLACVRSRRIAYRDVATCFAVASLQGVGMVRRQQSLGGMLNFYCREAA